jgi:hypothetical protein
MEEWLLIESSKPKKMNNLIIASVLWTE